MFTLFLLQALTGEDTGPAPANDEVNSISNYIYIYTVIDYVAFQVPSPQLAHSQLHTQPLTSGLDKKSGAGGGCETRCGASR